MELLVILTIVSLFGGCIGYCILDGPYSFARGAVGIFVLIGLAMWLG